jgi:hypothetical protein
MRVSSPRAGRNAIHQRVIGAGIIPYSRDADRIAGGAIREKAAACTRSGQRFRRSARK